MNTQHQSQSAQITTSHKDELIFSLQLAAEKKGKTPTAQDADRRRYGLETKTHYVHQFGSWNKAIVAAGLEVNRFRYARSTQPSEGPFTGPTEQLNSIETWMESRLADERAEIRVMERLLAQYRAQE